MKKINGVESTKVSLNQGLVTIQLKPGNSVSMEQIRKAITDQGFTPRDAKVTAVGELVSQAGKQLQFKVTGTSDVFQVMPTPHSQLKSLPGPGEQTVEGMIPAQTNGPASIQIVSVKESDERK